MSINLRQMEVFRAVMQSGGVNSAAQLLHVSPPAISKVLAQAAKASELVLFERVKGRLIPTPEAQRLFEEIERRLDRRRARARARCRARAGPRVDAAPGVHRQPGALPGVAHHGPHVRRLPAPEVPAAGAGPGRHQRGLAEPLDEPGHRAGPAGAPQPGRGQDLCLRAGLRDAQRPPAVDRAAGPARQPRRAARSRRRSRPPSARRSGAPSAPRRPGCTSTSNASARPPPAGSHRPAWASRSSTRPPSPGGCWPGWRCGRSSPTSACRSGSCGNRYRPMSVVERAFVTRFDETWQTMDRPRARA